ncbi:hypothetical protein Syun_026447 [Stephania yunnanensis]|uniref:PPIase cyclophilin-type domain-containing protein n=1 Tax=Stephania yunnanensis TaxID=152371 RepID=A0AAP0HVR8_9MAGN
MSSIYVLEPPTRGKVIVTTSYGPLDIELWPKEAPKAVRNFVQLCLEGYYDKTIFHRVIKSFLVQGGDPTGTGSGGESIYGAVFADEFHSRLRFKHRGLVACANAGSPHSNGSQFFITLDRCDGLDKKHTIFGKVTGESVFNLLRLGEIETDKNDRPVDPPPRILSVEVLWNPFDDIVPRQAAARSRSQSTTDSEAKDQKRKAVKKLNLLSFGEEAEEEEKELAAVKEKIKSSHDVLDDPRLLKVDDINKESNSAEAMKTRALQLSVRETLSSKKEESQKEENIDSSGFHDLDDEDEAQFDTRMRLQILKKRKELGDLPIKKKQHKEFKPKAAAWDLTAKLVLVCCLLGLLSVCSKDIKFYFAFCLTPSEMKPEPRKLSSVKDHNVLVPPFNVFRVDSDDDADDGPKVERLSLKKKGLGSEARAELMAKADPDLQLMNHDEKVRQLHKQKKRTLQGRQDEEEIERGQVSSQIHLHQLPDPFSTSAVVASYSPTSSGFPRSVASQEQDGRIGRQPWRRRMMQAKKDLLDLLCVLAKLEKFKKSLSTKATTSNDGSGDGKDEDVSGWTVTQLKFAPESSKGGMTRNEDPNEYVVVDPLLEKGKEKFNKMQAKLKRRDREWAGKSLT